MLSLERPKAGKKLGSAVDGDWVRVKVVGIEWQWAWERGRATTAGSLGGFWRARLERRGEQRGDQGFCDLQVRCSKVVRGKSGQQVAQGSKVQGPNSNSRPSTPVLRLRNC